VTGFFKKVFLLKIHRLRYYVPDTSVACTEFGLMVSLSKRVFELDHVTARFLDTLKIMTTVFRAFENGILVQ
jgi:hypothetical protein